MNKKVLYIGAGTLIAGGITFILIKKFSNKRKIAEIYEILEGKKASGGQVIDTAGIANLPDGQFPLRFGNKNKKVAELQRALNVRYGSSLDIDGKFGTSTASVLCKNYFSTCFDSIQVVNLPSTYEITQTDFDKIKK